MLLLEIIMIVIGLGSIIYGKKLVDDKEKKEITEHEVMTPKDEEAYLKEIREKIENYQQELEEKKENTLQETQDQMGTLSNEKMIGISEYSDQVLDKIEKNHAEVVFLYDMLQEKQTELQEMIQNANVAKAEFQDEIAQSYQETKELLQQIAEEFVIERTARSDEIMVQDEQEEIINGRLTVLEQLQPEEIDAFDQLENPKSKAEVNHNEEILDLHKKGHSVLEISKLLEMGQGEVKFIIDMYGR